ncbi:TPM domain-containing protein [Candidatus Woesearchaeota archaeon]|nr:TPM domain-containing protein [Candidatus Woesearchaeota archaeon]
MKRILIILLLLPCVFAQIELTGYVNDYAGIISYADKLELEQICKQLQDSGTAEFAIVTVPSLEGRDIEGYAWELAEGKLGKKDKNNGLLLLVALDDRQYRFEVGRGLEPVLPDGKIGRIGRTYLVENFKNEEYGKGIKEAVLAVQAVLTEDAESEYYVTETVSQKWALVGMIVVFVMFILFIIVVINAAKHSKKRGDSDYFWAALIAGNMMRGRGGFGGFGGFGGGSFGGGGAGGGW